ncbi:MAG: RNA polymerase sigma factor [Planctomycetota bacterium]|nr:RNA polymerase sigma factor [Planctomycetota bacterium]
MTNPTNNPELLLVESRWLDRLACTLVGAGPDADDLVQETWVRALAHWRSPDRGGARAWLGTIARNLVRERRRGDSRRSAREESVARPIAHEDDAVSRAQLQRRLLDRVLALPDGERDAVLLYYFDDLSHGEVAARLELSSAAVRKRVSRAVARLRAEYEREERDRGGVFVLAPLAGWRASEAVTPAAAGLLGAGPKALVACGALIGLVALAALGGGGSAEPMDRPATDTTSSVAPSGAPGTMVSAATVPRTEVSVAGRPAVVLGRVVEAGTGFPVAATVRSQDGSAVSSLGNGRFRLVATSLPVELRVDHPAYSPLVVACESGEGVLLEVTPLERTRIQIVDEFARPVEGAWCGLEQVDESWVWSRSAPPDSIPRRFDLGATDADGYVTITTGSRSTLVVRGPGGSEARSQVHPSVDQQVILAGPPRHLRFVDDATSEPITNRLAFVEFSSLSGRSAVYARTDPEGAFALPGGSGDLTLHYIVPRLLIAAVEIDGVAVPSTGEVSRVVALGPGAREVTVRLTNAERLIRLVDDRTGAPIDGAVWWGEFNGRDRGSLTQRSILVDGGEMVVGKWFTTRAPSATRERWITAAGYELTRLDATADLDGSTVRLRRSAERYLRAVDSSGEPLQVHLLVVSSLGPEIEHVSNLDGVVGPLPWTPGESWTVHSLDRRSVPGAEVEVAPERIAASSIVEFELHGDTGKLVVTGVPDGAPPVWSFLDPSTSAPQPLVRDGSELVLSGAPTGRVAVGTRSFLGSCTTSTSGGSYASPTEADRYEVRAGEVTTIPWDHRWWQREPTTGQMWMLTGRTEDLLVMPIAGTLEGQFSLPDLGAWIPVAADGSFECPPERAQTSGLAFGVRRSNSRSGDSVQALDVVRVRPDGTYTLDLPSVEVRIGDRGGLQASARVRVRSEFGRTSSSGISLVGAPSWTWDTSEPLLTGRLPRAVTQLVIPIPSRKEPTVIHVEPTGHQRITIDLSGSKPEATSALEDPPGAVRLGTDR